MTMSMSMSMTRSGWSRSGYPEVTDPEVAMSRGDWSRSGYVPRSLVPKSSWSRSCVPKCPVSIPNHPNIARPNIALISAVVESLIHYVYDEPQERTRIIC